MIEKVYRVTGMGCASCVAHVKSAVQGIDGVEQCEVDLESEKLKVRYDEGVVSFDDMKNAVEDAGYGLEVI